MNPPNTGHISCDGREILTGQNLRLKLDSMCIAENNEGYQFASWVENIGTNASRTINSSSTTPDPFVSLSRPLGRNSTDAASFFSVTNSGRYTANFQEVPPPIPPEYYIPLYGILASTLVGWSIPSIIGWVKSKRQTTRLNFYHKSISSIYTDEKLDDKDIKVLDKLRTDISDSYGRGGITNEHYTNLKNEISTHYQEIFKEKIDSLDVSSRNYKEREGEIIEGITDAYAKGKLNESHYNLLNQQISRKIRKM